MPNILLVEDDDALSEGIALALRAQGTVRRCPTLAEARKALGRAGFDLMILDINLPDGSGLALLRERPAGFRTPVLVLTANDLEIDIVNGLEAGARPGSGSCGRRWGSSRSGTRSRRCRPGSRSGPSSSPCGCPR